MVDQFTEDVTRLQEQGLSERKIATELKVTRSKVHDTLVKLKQMEASKNTVSEDKMREIIREELEHARKADEEDDNADGRFPMVRKMGGGAEAIAPEAVLSQYMGGSTPEERLELRAIMKFRAAMLMVMDLVSIQKGSAEADAKRMEPVLKLMKETREEQDAAAARAKASSEEIADRAAHETASQVFGAISQSNTQTSSSLDQIRQLLTGKNDDPFSRLLNMMQSMQQMAQMFGMPLPGMMPGAMQPGGPPGGQPPPESPPIERHSINELEGNDV